MSDDASSSVHYRGGSCYMCMIECILGIRRCESMVEMVDDMLCCVVLVCTGVHSRQDPAVLRSPRRTGHG